ncbi:hypothetical protein PR202_gb11879 [Eleusine coracana subsp. coracana]|uniref:DRBM domain-containing protein n=1 Tax=Eleusine coracana subsp. coracana TaxID=191504 RepID=A0AAV5EP30_ELECO|nr:hypothetical protein PR202_gb11879 [Eleusine coracana subsp. coracana]
MKRLLEPLATPETVEHDPVKELQEFCDHKSCSVSYTETHENGVSSVVAVVQVEGITYSATRTGLGKFVAKKLAAKCVLQDLKAAELDGCSKARTTSGSEGTKCNSQIVLNFS